MRNRARSFAMRGVILCGLLGLAPVGVALDATLSVVAKAFFTQDRTVQVAGWKRAAFEFACNLRGHGFHDGNGTLWQFTPGYFQLQAMCSTSELAAINREMLHGCAPDGPIADYPGRTAFISELKMEIPEQIMAEDKAPEQTAAYRILQEVGTPPEIAEAAAVFSRHPSVERAPKERQARMVWLERLALTEARREIAQGVTDDGTYKPYQYTFAYQLMRDEFSPSELVVIDMDLNWGSIDPIGMSTWPKMDWGWSR